MFRNRNSSQKPSDELYKHFKASFPSLRPGSSEESAPVHGVTSLTDALDVGLDSRHYGEHGHHNGEPTPKASEPWSFSGTGLTPSVLDPDSHSFNAFANQMPGYYTPTPGGTNTYYHSHHAGDLHTPNGFHMGLGTPLSMPTSEAGLASGQAPIPIHAFNPQQTHLHHVEPPQFHAMNPYQMHQQPAFPPQNFQTGPIGFHHMDSNGSGSPSMGDINMDLGFQNESPEMLFHPELFQPQTASPSRMQHPLMEKFRYHTTLNAPTAMVKNTDEIPITYLNKGQAYTLNVTDTAPQHSIVGQLKYRTFVRVSFEDDEQRSRPGACWQLWKEGRGTSEAHQRGGRLQAVEYVDPSQMNRPADDPSKARMELESASFDGFCVTWTPGTNGVIECPIPVRFNFLSTDFSHSKGVKGIPVRLCAKTELLLDSMSPNVSLTPAHEVCFCKVKLFRDHGAERKLSNDVAHVKKTIDKLNQQLAQIESGMRDLGKRKRSNGASGGDAQRPGKVQKHRRTWSLSSANSSGGRASAEEELQSKLVTLQDMFSSTRQSSILFLRGDPEDDPDLHPVRMTGDSTDGPKVEPVETSGWDKQSIQSSTMVSPTPSSQSILSNRRDSHFQRFGPPSRVSSNEWKGQQQTAITDLQSNPQHLASPPDQPVKVQTSSPTSGTLSGWIETLGVDASYQPPPERAVKPVACFYVQPRVAGNKSEDQYYRAIYLMQRTLKDFVTAIAMKSGIEPTKVIRTVRINRKGLNILLDDDAMRELPEGQDMTAEFHAIDATAAPSRQWDSGANEVMVDGELPTAHDQPSSGYELKLLY